MSMAVISYLITAITNELLFKSPEGHDGEFVVFRTTPRTHNFYRATAIVMDVRLNGVHLSIKLQGTPLLSAGFCGTSSMLECKCLSRSPESQGRFCKRKRWVNTCSTCVMDNGFMA